MADNDDRSVLQVTADGEGKPALQSLNEILRQVQMNIYKLEGRLGEATVRDDLRVMGKLTLEDMTEPSAEADTGIIIFDKDEQILKASEDGGSFVPLIYVAPVTTPEVYPKLRMSVTLTTTTTGVESGALSYGSNIFDTDSMHDTVGSPTQVIITRDGYYVFSSALTWTLNATGTRVINIKKNGSTQVRVVSAATPSLLGNVNHAVCLISCVIGDIITTTAQQNSGGNLDVTGGQFYAHRVV